MNGDNILLSSKFSEDMQPIRDQCPNDKLFSVENARLPIEPGCKWIKTSIVEGEGKDGIVYRVCKQCDDQDPVCSYVVKHIKRNSAVDVFQKDFQKEVQMHILLRDSGISPNVYDAFICGDEGYIILDRKDYNIKEYAFKLLEALKKPDLVFDILKQLQASVIRLVGQLHTYSYIHNDPHLQNFMIDIRNGDLVNWRNPQIIDFGKVIKVESPLVANQKESVEGINMSFDMLRREVLDKEKIMQLTDPETIARHKILSKGIPEAPRKGKIPAKKPLVDTEDSSFSPPKKSKQIFDNFDSPVKPKPFSSNLFDSPEFTPSANREAGKVTPVKGGLFNTPGTPQTPVRGGLFNSPDTPQTPVNNNLFGSFDDDDSPSTPVRGNSMFDTPQKNNNSNLLFDTPEKDSFKLSYDSEDEDDSFLSRRYYPYRIGGEDRSVDMIDPEYYEDGDYDNGETEYLEEWDGID